MRLTFAPAAAEDIDRIWDYTAENWGVDQADKYVDDIKDVCGSLADGKKKGRKVHARSGYFKYAVGRHYVFFRRQTAEIEVIRILHQSMDMKRHL